MMVLDTQTVADDLTEASSKWNLNLTKNTNVNFSLRLKAEKGQLDDMHLLLSLKRSLQLYTPKQLKVTQDSVHKLQNYKK